MVGHSINNFKKIQVADEGLIENNKRNNLKNKGNTKKVYVQKKDKRLQ